MVGHICLAALLYSAALSPARGQGGRGQFQSLKNVAVPEPSNLDQYVRDKGGLVALGKAFFWDMQAGSDGHTACATCHFHAGADHRTQNQIASPPGAGFPFVPNQALAPGDFPFYKLSDPNNNNSAVISDSRLVAGSAGQFHRTFLAPSGASDDGVDIFEALFSIGGIKARQVTGRNSPTVINAVYNLRNFWDGRASDIFTGGTPFGEADPAANALAYRDGGLRAEKVRLPNSSLASVAVGPPLNATEMSYAGRTWPELGRRLLPLAPLVRQQVAADDSVLGAMANAGGNGLRAEFSYAALVRAAFQPAYWSAPDTLGRGTAALSIVRGPRPGATNGFTQMELNFPLFWGLAVQAYLATLVSDHSPADQFAEGNSQALTALESQGLARFQGSQCVGCHSGAETTAASVASVARAGRTNTPNGLGFRRTAVTLPGDDTGMGGVDGFGNAIFPANPAAANGVFKIATLRNVEFTGPYFHNGGQATLEQVIDFYGRNGDVPPGDRPGAGTGNLRLSPQDRPALVAFLKALSDNRVRFEQAPFDHPALCIPTGLPENASGNLELDTSDPRFTASGLEHWALIPAVGKGGNRVPLQTFEELLAGTGNDGSRAHALTTACVP